MSDQTLDSYFPFCHQVGSSFVGSIFGQLLDQHLIVAWLEPSWLCLGAADQPAIVA